jgi:NADH dehydrogenase FAD-containing subunit
MSQQLQSLRQFITLPSSESLIVAGVSLAFGAFVLNTAWRSLDTRPTPVKPTDLDATMSKTVVILGGGLSGIATAHKLLKHTAPKLKGLKVILISASSHFYFNFAAVRGLIPGEIPDDALFRAIEPGFDKYPRGSFEFVVGTATGLDLAGNAVQVRTAVGTGERTIVYDQLVVATGSSLATDLPFKNLGSYQRTIEEWHKLQGRVKAAKSIVVAGAGPTGVETMAELAGKYGTSKKLTLVIDGEHALPGLMPSVGKQAEAELAKMKVELLHKVRVNGVEDIDGGAKLTLSNGETLVADVFLPLYGVRPNTEFVPANLLEANGSVKVDKTLRVEGSKNVWAVGDVNNVELKAAMKAESQVVHLHPNLEAVLLGRGEATLAEYKPSEKKMMFVTLGKKKGTGQMGTFKVFSFLVSYVKGRTLFVEKAPVIVEGKGILQASI